MGIWDSIKKSFKEDFLGNHQPQDVDPPYSLTSVDFRSPTTLTIESDKLVIDTSTFGRNSKQTVFLSTIMSLGMEEEHGTLSKSYFIIEDRGGTIRKIGPFPKKTFVTGYALLERLLAGRQS